MEINLLIFLEGLQTLKIANILFILVGVAESKLNTLMTWLKYKLNYAFDLSILVKTQFALRFHSLPLSMIDSVYRPIVSGILRL